MTLLTSLTAANSHLAVPVVGGALVKLLPQLEGDLGVLEGALGADDHLVALLADDDGGLGHVAHLPGGEAHAWTGRRRCKKGDGSGQRPGSGGERFTVLFLTLRHRKRLQGSRNTPTLTQGFHVLVEVLAVDQFPGGTEGVDHGEGFLGGGSRPRTRGAAAASAGFFVSPLELLSCSLSRRVPAWGGGRGLASHWLRRFSLGLVLLDISIGSRACRPL